MTIIEQPRYPALDLAELTEHDPQIASEAVISGRFTFREAVAPNGGELDRRWFQPYPSQD